ncbi:hypothetical protein [Chlorobium ferrooxidans]|nr:hypothetical protein [Chlorobium ferrooxidans]
MTLYILAAWVGTQAAEIPQKTVYVLQYNLNEAVKTLQCAGVKDVSSIDKYSGSDKELGVRFFNQFIHGKLYPPEKAAYVSTNRKEALSLTAKMKTIAKGYLEKAIAQHINLETPDLQIIASAPEADYVGSIERARRLFDSCWKRELSYRIQNLKNDHETIPIDLVFEGSQLQIEQPSLVHIQLKAKRAMRSEKGCKNIIFEMQWSCLNSNGLDGGNAGARSRLYLIDGESAVYQNEYDYAGLVWFEVDPGQWRIIPWRLVSWQRVQNDKVTETIELQAFLPSVRSGYGTVSNLLYNISIKR